MGAVKKNFLARIYDANKKLINFAAQMTNYFTFRQHNRAYTRAPANIIPVRFKNLMPNEIAEKWADKEITTGANHFPAVSKAYTDNKELSHGLSKDRYYTKNIDTQESSIKEPVYATVKALGLTKTTLVGANIRIVGNYIVIIPAKENYTNTSAKIFYSDTSIASNHEWKSIDFNGITTYRGKKSDDTSTQTTKTITNAVINDVWYDKKTKYYIFGGSSENGANTLNIFTSDIESADRYSVEIPIDQSTLNTNVTSLVKYGITKISYSYSNPYMFTPFGLVFTLSYSINTETKKMSFTSTSSNYTIYSSDGTDDVVQLPDNSLYYCVGKCEYAYMIYGNSKISRDIGPNGNEDKSVLSVSYDKVTEDIRLLLSGNKLYGNNDSYRLQYLDISEFTATVGDALQLATCPRCTLILCTKGILLQKNTRDSISIVATLSEANDRRIIYDENSDSFKIFECLRNDMLKIGEIKKKIVTKLHPSVFGWDSDQEAILTQTSARLVVGELYSVSYKSYYFRDWFGSMLSDFFDNPSDKFSNSEFTIYNKDGTIDRLAEWGFASGDKATPIRLSGDAKGGGFICGFLIANKSLGGIRLYITPDGRTFTVHDIIKTTAKWDKYVSPSAAYLVYTPYTDGYQFFDMFITRFFRYLPNGIYGLVDLEGACDRIYLYSIYSRDPIDEIVFTDPAEIEALKTNGFSMYCNSDGEFVVYINEYEMDGIVIGYSRSLETAREVNLPTIDNTAYRSELITSPQIRETINPTNYYIDGELTADAFASELAISEPKYDAESEAALPYMYLGATYEDARVNQKGDNSLSIYIPEGISFGDNVDIDYSDFVSVQSHPNLEDNLVKVKYTNNSLPLKATRATEDTVTTHRYAPAIVNYPASQNYHRMFVTGNRIFASIMSMTGTNYLYELNPDGSLKETITLPSTYTEFFGIRIYSNHAVIVYVTPESEMCVELISVNTWLSMDKTSSHVLQLYDGEYPKPLFAETDESIFCYILMSYLDSHGNYSTTSQSSYSIIEVKKNTFTFASGFLDLMDQAFNDITTYTSKYLRKFNPHMICGDIYINGVKTRVRSLYVTYEQCSQDPRIYSSGTRTVTTKIIYTTGNDSNYTILLNDKQQEFSSVATGTIFCNKSDTDSTMVKSNIFWAYTIKNQYANAPTGLVYSLDGINWEEYMGAIPFTGNGVYVFAYEGKLCLSKGTKLAIATVSSINDLYSPLKWDIIDVESLDGEVKAKSISNESAETTITSIGNIGSQVYSFMYLNEEDQTNLFRANVFVGFNINEIPDSFVYNEKEYFNSFNLNHPHAQLRTTSIGNMLKSNPTYKVKHTNNPSFNYAKIIEPDNALSSVTPSIWYKPNMGTILDKVWIENPSSVQFSKTNFNCDYVGDNVYVFWQLSIDYMCGYLPYIIVHLTTDGNGKQHYEVLSYGDGAKIFPHEMMLTFEAKKIEFDNGKKYYTAICHSWPQYSGESTNDIIAVNELIVNEAATDLREKYKMKCYSLNAPNPQLQIGFEFDMVQTPKGYLLRSGHGDLYFFDRYEERQKFNPQTWTQLNPDEFNGQSDFRDQEVIILNNTYLGMGKLAFVREWADGDFQKSQKVCLYDIPRTDYSISSNGTWRYDDIPQSNMGIDSPIDSIRTVNELTYIFPETTGKSNYEHYLDMTTNGYFRVDFRDDYGTGKPEFRTTRDFIELHRNGRPFPYHDMIVCGKYLINILECDNENWTYTIAYAEIYYDHEYKTITKHINVYGDSEMDNGSLMIDDSDLNVGISNLSFSVGKILKKDDTHFAVVVRLTEHKSSGSRPHAYHIDEFHLSDNGKVLG